MNKLRRSKFTCSYKYPEYGYLVHVNICRCVQETTNIFYLHPKCQLSKLLILFYVRIKKSYKAVFSLNYFQ